MLQLLLGQIAFQVVHDMQGQGGGLAHVRHHQLHHLSGHFVQGPGRRNPE